MSRFSLNYMIKAKLFYYIFHYKNVIEPAKLIMEHKLIDPLLQQALA